MKGWQLAFEENVRKFLALEPNSSEREFVKNTLKGMSWVFYHPKDHEFMKECLDKVALESGYKSRNDILIMLDPTLEETI